MVHVIYRADFSKKKLLSYEANKVSGSFILL